MTLGGSRDYCILGFVANSLLCYSDIVLLGVLYLFIWLSVDTTMPGAHFTSDISIALKLYGSFVSFSSQFYVVATKYCAQHGSCGVMAFAKLCCSHKCRNGITVNGIFMEFWIPKNVMEMGPYPRTLCLIQIIVFQFVTSIRQGKKVGLNKTLCILIQISLEFLPRFQLIKKQHCFW